MPRHDKVNFRNPFHLIVFDKIDALRHPVNRLFGKPPGISVVSWPRRNGKPLHHVLTFLGEGLAIPGPEDTVAFSIFAYFDMMDPELPRLTESLAIHRLTAQDLDQERQPAYPGDYEPWWKNSHPRAKVFEAGIPFALNKIETIPEDIIREMLASREKIIWELPPALEVVQGKSFIGGCPLWMQLDETPVDATGHRTHFVMQIEGYQHQFEAAIIGLGVLYLFMDAAGDPYWVGQSD